MGRGRRAGEGEGRLAGSRGELATCQDVRGLAVKPLGVDWARVVQRSGERLSGKRQVDNLASALQPDSLPPLQMFALRRAAIRCPVPFVRQAGTAAVAPEAANPAEPQTSRSSPEDLYSSGLIANGLSRRG